MHVPPLPGVEDPQSFSNEILGEVPLNGYVGVYYEVFGIVHPDSRSRRTISVLSSKCFPSALNSS